MQLTQKINTKEDSSVTEDYRPQENSFHGEFRLYCNGKSYCQYSVQKGDDAEKKFPAGIVVSSQSRRLNGRRCDEKVTQ